MTVLAVMLAGAFGAVARFVVDGAMKRRVSTTYPWATLTINVTGSLLLGVLAGLVIFHSAPDDLKAIIGTGFCGGYTTFSTASFETARLTQGNRLRALAYVLMSVLGSVIGCAAGLVLAWVV
ncbi:fluoride efflux transporter CrcB [Gordonia insulae]|uniref:Fluoride-specific ion channel FluC n=1 Tax=Gordonia insulae TaxID=2420509 RepID=A0A3G8JUP6_9ACTN|nr:fluoride efflux transporter CrcB [Gordonia insulae]AZG48606.1 Putative fluoride ion transporter CrcB [Gordonia insulae]